MFFAPDRALALDFKPARFLADWTDGAGGATVFGWVVDDDAVFFYDGVGGLHTRDGMMHLRLVCVVLHFVPSESDERIFPRRGPG